MLHLIVCLLIVFLFSKIFEKALVANSHDIVLEIDDDDDYETGKASVVEDILDELISFVRGNNEKLECLACVDAIKAEKDEEVASLVLELIELVQEQQVKIDKQYLQKLEEKNRIIDELTRYNEELNRYNEELIYYNAYSSFEFEALKNRHEASLTAVESA